MRHEVIHPRPGSAMLSAASQGWRFSVRRLEAFDDAVALALAAVSDAPDATRYLKRLQALWRQQQAESVSTRHDGWHACPCPLLVLGEDAAPVALLPLLLWRPAQNARRTGLRGLLTLAGTGGAISARHAFIRRHDVMFTELQLRSLWQTVLHKLPAEADLLLCQPLPPAAALDEEAIMRLARRDALLLRRVLPCPRAAHPLSWRGWLALLRARMNSWS